MTNFSMINVFLGLVLNVVVGLPAVWAQGTSQIPNGYSEGAPNAIYGTYATPVSERARPYQNRLLDLEKKAYGLAGIQNTDPVQNQMEVSRLGFLLENQIFRLNLDIANAPAQDMTEFERKALLYGCSRIYKDVRHYAERIFEDMVRFIDVKLPGPNGLQLREELKNSNCVYACNYRSSEALSSEEQAKLYKAKLDSFISEGGSLSEIRELNANYLKSLSEYTRVEYVQLESGVINVTSGSAGHILLAQGKKVLSAGQIVLLKAKNGNFIFSVISNASGSYKPDLLSAQLLANKLSQTLGLRPDQIIITKGEPISTQAVKIYLKGLGVDKELIKSKIKELDNEAKELLSKAPASRISSRCAATFSK